MTIDLILAITVYAFVTTITPGPNNMMLLASGVNFGFRRSWPHMLGITVGFSVMLVLVGLGLGEVFARYPAIYTVLRYVGGAFMLYLAWKIATAGPIGEGESRGRPMSFIAAAAFQWVNPKAWIMAVTATAAYTVPQLYLLSVSVMGLIFALMCLPCVVVWTLFGTALKHWLSDPGRLKLFNYAMGLALALSLWPIVAG
jgi:threonine/homoserine/homoserine lactone efflux protein